MKFPNYSCHTYGNVKPIIKLFFFLFLLFISSYSFSQTPKIKAFPTAEGFGKYATGGRGGKVLKVTNLNDSGKGSLRDALMNASGARTIVFEVGGTITLKSLLSVKNGNVTVAGQTAPGDGILIKGSTVVIESSNVILRHLRFRLSASSGDLDAVSITAWRSDTVENVILDHCSISWGEDENLNLRAATNGLVRNVTIQNSIISESGYGVLATKGTENITFYKNLFAHNKERNVRSNKPNNGALHFEMVNNLIYGFKYATGVSLGNRITVINNYYKKSNEVAIMGKAIEGTTAGEGNVRDTYAYISGNVVPTGFQEYNSLLSPYLKSKPVVSSGINPINANQIASDILPHVGASLPTRDEVDVRVINQFNKGNGRLVSSGKFPIIKDGKAQADSDNDGMPDAWEIANGLNPNNANDRNLVQPDGYTNLEYFLNGLSLPNQIPNATFTSHTETICKGSSIVLTANGGSKYSWDNGEKTASIKVAPSATTSYTVTAFNSSGKVIGTEKFEVNVNQTLKVSAGNDITINSGEKVTLTAAGAKSYMWNTGNKSASISVSPKTTTTYSVKGQSAEGCEAEATVRVTVRETSSESVTADAGADQRICSGTVTTLTARGGNTYLWSTGEKTATIKVSPKTSTTYRLTAYDKSGKNSDTADVTVYVNSLPNISAGKDVTINAGEQVNLTATGAKSYLWNTGDKNSSISVSPKTSTTYSVKGTTAEGCEAEATVRVTVRVPSSEPVKADAGADKHLCSGTSTTLTARGGNSYLWNTGDKTASIRVSPSKTTTYTVKAYDKTGKSYDTAKVTVYVNPSPNLNAGKDVTINAGERVKLSATGAKYYMWSTGDKTASTIVSPKTTTTYSVKGKIVEGCEGHDTVRVIVRTAPLDDVKASAGKDQRICSGSSTTLTASGGSSYLWSTGEKSPTIKVSPSKTTTYSVKVYDKTRKKSNTAKVSVYVNPSPKLNAGKNVTINPGKRVKLTATGAKYYMWNTGDKSASTIVKPKKTTTYHVKGKIVEGCESHDSVTVYVKSAATKNSEIAGNDDSGKDDNILSTYPIDEGIVDEINELELKVFPNPTHGEVNINISGLSSLASINLYDFSGKLLLSQKISEGNTAQFDSKLDLSQYEAGIYLLQLVDNEKVITKKIILR